MNIYAVSIDFASAWWKVKHMQKSLKWHLYRNGASVIYSMNEHQRFMCEAIDYNRMVKYNSRPFPAAVM